MWRECLLSRFYFLHQCLVSPTRRALTTCRTPFWVWMEEKHSRIVIFSYFLAEGSSLRKHKTQRHRHTHIRTHTEKKVQGLSLHTQPQMGRPWFPPFSLQVIWQEDDSDTLVAYVIDPGEFENTSWHSEFSTVETKSQSVSQSVSQLARKNKPLFNNFKGSWYFHNKMSLVVVKIKLQNCFTEVLVKG